MWDAWLDLMLGSECAGCGCPGRALCRTCRAALPRAGRAAWPTPAPEGLVRPFAAGEYDDVLKRLINAHKEQRRIALARPLGAVLAAVVADLLVAAGHRGDGTRAGGVRLVPVPSSPAVVRRRGHEPVLRMARAAATVLRGAGTPAAVERALVLAGRPEDQAGLGAEARAANLAGTMRARVAPRLPGARSAATRVVVDDVITTGATVREAQRALEDAGLQVLGAATLAATRRRFAEQRGSGPSLPFRVRGD